MAGLKLYDFGLGFVLIALATAAAITYVSVKYTGKEDNAVEETCEVLLFEVTGFDLDLTPLSKE